MSEGDRKGPDQGTNKIVEPAVASRRRERAEKEADDTSYILIEDADFKTLTEHCSGKGHKFINSRLQEAFDRRRNCLVVVPIYTAKGGTEWERTQSGQLPAKFLEDDCMVTYQGEKVLLYGLVFNEDDFYVFRQINQAKFQELLRDIEAEAKKALGGGVFGRRAALAALLLGAVGLGAATMRYISSRQLHDLLAKDAPALPSVAPPASLTPEMRETPENIKNLPGLAAVLDSSLVHFETASRTLRDPLLKSEAVSEAFLDNRFQYTGQAEKTKETNSPYKDQRIHTFTVIGERSSHYGHQGRDMFQKTYLEHAINTLLYARNLSDDQIKEWIVFNYQRAFNLALDASRITLTRSSRTREVSYVTYDPPAGFVNNMPIKFARPIEDVSPLNPGGNITVDEKTVPILASDNRLMLQSGVSPDHDLQVPENLMDLDKTCTRPLGKDGSLGTIEMTAGELAYAIHRYHEIIDNQLDMSALPYSTDGRQHQLKLCSPFVDEKDPIVRRLARMLLPKGTNAKAATQIFTDFVQRTPYKGENAADYNRPAACTIFNNGSDCNSLALLWVSLNTVYKIPHAIFYFVDKNPQSRKAHVTAGVHERLVPTEEEKLASDACISSLGLEPIPRPQLVTTQSGTGTRFYNQELTAEGFSPGDDAFHNKMEIVAAEYVQFSANTPEPIFHVSMRGKPQK